MNSNPRKDIPSKGSPGILWTIKFINVQQIPQWAVSFPKPGINGCIKNIGELLDVVVVPLTAGCWYGEPSDWGTCMWQELIQGLGNVMNIQNPYFVLFEFLFL